MALDPRKLRAEGQRHGFGQDRLAYAGYIFDEQVTARESRNRRGRDSGLRAEEHVPEVLHDGVPECHRRIEIAIRRDVARNQFQGPSFHTRSGRLAGPG